MPRRFSIIILLVVMLCLLGFASPTHAASQGRTGCSPQNLTPNSTLTMTLPWPHGGILDIEGPQPEQIYYTVIIYDDPNVIGFRPIISAQRFEHMRSLTLAIQDIKGDDLDPYDISRPRRNPQRIFTVSGDYTIYIVANNDDAGEHFFTRRKMCAVHYVDAKFKGPAPKRRYKQQIYDVAE